MFSATSIVLSKLIEEGSKSSQRGEAFKGYNAMMSFDFIFVLHLMKEIMEITDMLCQDLQSMSMTCGDKKIRDLQSHLQVNYLSAYSYCLLLMLTLSVSTTTTKKEFFAKKIVKTRFHNKIENGFLSNFLIIYIEKKIVQTFSVDSIIDRFQNMKTCQVLF
ncbi:hypothetical protein SLE2022_326740 [Rubroshorea leprosula]